jgi:hypothetical protein
MPEPRESTAEFSSAGHVRRAQDSKRKSHGQLKIMNQIHAFVAGI